MRTTSLAYVAAMLLSCSQLTAAAPLPQDDGKAVSDTDWYHRLMPLGASITQGIGSSDGCGYRKILRGMLETLGWKKINMVGSKKDGKDFPDNVSEQIHIQ